MKELFRLYKGDSPPCVWIGWTITNIAMVCSAVVFILDKTGVL